MIDTLDAIVEMVKRFEGVKLRAYRCPAGVLTIGFGSTIGVTEGMVWTQEQANADLRKQVAQFMLAVLKRCPQLHLEPQELLIACTSLAYNIGAGAFGASQVCRKTKYRDYLNAAKSFMNWRFIHGAESLGLKNRRTIEQAKYLSGVQ
jgi:lysozyme